MFTKSGPIEGFFENQLYLLIAFISFLCVKIVKLSVRKV